jgi:hypothetical protein
VLGEVKVAFEKLENEVKLGEDVDPQVKLAIGFLGTAVKLLLDSQKNLTSALIDTFKVSTPGGKNSASLPQQGTVRNDPPRAPSAKPADIKEKKVKQAIRDAEKKVLLFNLDMGNVPTMNKETLSRKVTLALSSAASSGNHDYDIKDAEEVIDDVLSCTKLEFLGTTTKKFFNKKNLEDPRNDVMCTMPVRFEFKDKDTRISAEKSLRKICKVSCAVPYPKKLRDMLDNLLKEGKKLVPKAFIRTRVNVDSLTIDVHARTDKGWQDLNLACPIPLDICDTAFSTVSTPSQAAPSQASQAVSEEMQVS